MISLNFQPLHNRFTARELPETESVIIFPEAYQPKPKTAQVIEISTMQPLSVQPGDIVHIGRHVKETVQSGVETLLLVEEGDIQLVNGTTHADRILIAVLANPDTIGGVFIPDGYRPKPSKGKIVSHGPKTDLKIDQLVHFQKTDGMPIKINGEDFLIMKDCDILGIED